MANNKGRILLSCAVVKTFGWIWGMTGESVLLKSFQVSKCLNGWQTMCNWGIWETEIEENEGGKKKQEDRNTHGVMETRSKGTLNVRMLTACLGDKFRISMLYKRPRASTQVVTFLKAVPSQELLAETKDRKTVKDLDAFWWTWRNTFLALTEGILFNIHIRDL